MNIKYIKVFLFFLIGMFLFKWVYEFFGSKESLELITENKSKLFFIILIHIPTLFLMLWLGKFSLKMKIFLFCGPSLLHGFLKRQESFFQLGL